MIHVGMNGQNPLTQTKSINLCRFYVFRVGANEFQIITGKDGQNPFTQTNRSNCAGFMCFGQVQMNFRLKEIETQFIMNMDSNRQIRLLKLHLTVTNSTRLCLFSYHTLFLYSIKYRFSVFVKLTYHFSLTYLLVSLFFFSFKHTN